MHLEVPALHVLLLTVLQYSLTQTHWASTPVTPLGQLPAIMATCMQDATGVECTLDLELLYQPLVHAR